MIWLDVSVSRVWISGFGLKFQESASKCRDLPSKCYDLTSKMSRFGVEMWEGKMATRNCGQQFKIWRRDFGRENVSKNARAENHVLASRFGKGGWRHENADNMSTCGVEIWEGTVAARKCGQTFKI